MPQRKCAAKRLKVDAKKTLHNLRIKSHLKKEIKGLRSLIASGKTDEAKQKLRIVFSRIDRAAAKGLLHKNTAARRKANLAKKLATA